MIKTYLYWRDRDNNVSRVQLNATDFIPADEWSTAVIDMVGRMNGISDATFIKAEQVYSYHEDVDLPINGINIAVKTAIMLGLDTDGNYVSYILPSPKEDLWDTTREPLDTIATDSAIAELKAALSDAMIVSPQNATVDVTSIVLIKAG